MTKLDKKLLWAQPYLKEASTLVNLDNLKGIYSRERDLKQSNAFSFSRFLVPYLCGYDGWGLFLDADMILTDDIAKLFALKDIPQEAREVPSGVTQVDGDWFIPEFSNAGGVRELK